MLTSWSVGPMVLEPGLDNFWLVLHAVRHDHLISKSKPPLNLARRLNTADPAGQSRTSLAPVMYAVSFLTITSVSLLMS